MFDIWGGYDEWAPSNNRSLLQNVVPFIGLFAKETCDLKEPTDRSHPIYVSNDIALYQESCIYIRDVDLYERCR